MSDTESPLPRVEDHSEVMATDGLDNSIAMDAAGAAEAETGNNNTLDFSDDDDDENLSQFSDGDFNDDELQGIDDLDDRPEIALDESNIGSLKIHKRQRTEGETREKSVSRREQERKRKRPTDTRDADGDVRIRESVPERELTKEERAKKELDDKINDAIKGGRQRRKKKADGEDLDRMQEDMIENLKNRMTLAAKKDADDKDAGRPAMHKLKMLDEVLDVFNKQHLHYVILENNLLESVRFWLEPLPDKSLPAYNIQRDLFNILTKMNIQTDNLRQSGLGKIVLFYSKDVRPEESIRRQAEKLVREWSRPILGKSDDYRHRVLEYREFDTSGPRKKQHKQQAAEIPVGLSQPRLKTNRTSIPDNTPVSYSIVPVSQVNRDSQDSRISRPMGASADDSIRRMKARLGGPAKKGKKGLSIEGRGLH